VYADQLWLHWLGKSLASVLGISRSLLPGLTCQLGQHNGIGFFLIKFFFAVDYMPTDTIHQSEPSARHSLESNWEKHVPGDLAGVFTPVTKSCD
jgi:hypothetical protein